MGRLPFQYAFRNLGRGRARLVALLGGSALLVVMVTTGAGFARGMRVALTGHTPLHENVILLGAGSEGSLERSSISASVAGIAGASLPTVLRVAGVSMVSPEVHMAVPVRERPGGREMAGVFRGVRDEALLVHPAVEIVEGRAPRAGAQEIMAGALVPTRLGLDAARLAVGRTLEIGGSRWTIVGRFTAPGTVMDAEIWMPLGDLQVVTKREGTLSCVIVSIEEGGFGGVDLFAKSRLDLEIVAERERAYYASLASFYRPIRVLVYVTSALVALGALLGGLNTMYASVAVRVREFGALRAVGFRRRAILLSLAQESLFASACGTIAGLAAARLLLDGLGVRFSMGAFTIMIDAPVVVIGVVAGLGVGVIGVLPPAWRCLRMPVPEALRAL